MRLPAGFNKWGSAVLGLISAVLVINLVNQYRGMQAASPQAHASPANAPAKPSGKVSTEDLAKYDPSVHFDALKELDSRPLPDEDRNPFLFAGQSLAPPPPPPSVQQAAAVPQAPPPPPPPPPLKAVGYNELPGGKREAMLTYNDDISVVHEGDVIGGKFKVIKIDPSMVVVEDAESHKNIELQFPQ